MYILTIQQNNLPVVWVCVFYTLKTLIEVIHFCRKMSDRDTPYFNRYYEWSGVTAYSCKITKHN